MTVTRVLIRRKEAEEVSGYLQALAWILRRRVLADAVLIEWMESGTDDHLVMQPLRYGLEVGGPEMVAFNADKLRESVDDARAVAHLEEGYMDEQLAEDIDFMAAALSNCIETIQQIVAGDTLTREAKAQLDADWNVLESLRRRYRRRDS